MEADSTDPVAPAPPDAPASADGLVFVDRIGMPVARAPGSAGDVLALGVPESARQRLLAAGAKRLLGTLSDATEADLVVVSTRLPRGEAASQVASVLRDARCPAVVLAHTGGESAAVEIMRLGAIGVVAEGNEAALGAFLVGETHDSTLLETYDRQIGASQGHEDSARDEVTGLPRRPAFDQRLAELAQSGDVPRVGYVRILHFDDVTRRLAPSAIALLRRRLATRFRELTRHDDVELYSLGQVDFALLGENLTPHRAADLGARMARETETFAPNGNQPLALALGHAGSEVSTEITTLCELAERALMVAASTQRSEVVGADALALGVSSTTELEAAYRLLAYIEKHDGHPAGHGERVATLAAQMARELGYEGLARSRIQLAAHLHDIGKAGLPVQAMAGPAELSGDALWAYRSHPLRGADYLRVSGGPEVAEAVRHHHEHWDGSGFPDGLAGDSIPFASRLIAVANRYDALCNGAPGIDALSPQKALEQLQEEAGTLLDPELVTLLTTLLSAVETPAAA